MISRAARFGIVLAVALGARDVRAYDAVVDATFDAQVYQVTSPYGDPILARRRYTETLGLRMTNLQGLHDPGRGELSAVVRLRLDGDFGQDPRERSPTHPDRYVPGLEDLPLDLMMAYVEGRNYFGGLVGFRLGRQYVVDPLGFWSFDGGLVRLTTPAYVAFETYGGFEQRGGLNMLSTSRFEGDGVMRGSRKGFDPMSGSRYTLDPNFWPAYLSETKLAPAYGFAVATAGIPFLDARLTYRKVVNRDTVVTSAFPDASGNFVTGSGDRVSTERVGLAATATREGLGALRGDAVYDLLVEKPSEYSLSADLRAIQSIDLGVDGQYFLPTFDGDSIFNWFSHYGTTTITGRARWDATRRVSFGGSGGIRRFSADQGAPLIDALASLNGTYRAPELLVTLRAMDEQGERGKRIGGDVSTRRTFLRGSYDATAIISVYGWSDALRPDRSATSFQYVLGGGFRPSAGTRLGLEWEHAASALVGERFRALATLDLTVL